MIIFCHFVFRFMFFFSVHPLLIYLTGYLFVKFIVYVPILHKKFLVEYGNRTVRFCHRFENAWRCVMSQLVQVTCSCTELWHDVIPFLEEHIMFGGGLWLVVQIRFPLLHVNAWRLVLQPIQTKYMWTLQIFTDTVSHLLCHILFSLSGE
jgi:hypothetical protein